MKTITLIATILILFGCATGYQRQGMTGGYSSTQLDTNLFRVTFVGNGYTGMDRASDFALLRSAELAIENGYEYFSIIDAQQHLENSSFTLTPTTSTTNFNATTDGTAHLHGNTSTYSGTTHGTATTTTYGGQTYHISKPRNSNTIVCFKERPEGFSYNARFIAKSLKEKYELNRPNKAN